MKLPHTEVKFYPEVKSQTSLSSLRASCKRALKSDMSALVLPYATNYIRVLQKPWGQRIVSIIFGRNPHNLLPQMEYFLNRLKLYPREGLKEIHSLVRDDTDRKRVYAYKIKSRNTK